jgi:hypothetical protein
LAERAVVAVRLGYLEAEPAGNDQYIYEVLSNIPYLTARATITAYAKLTADVAVGYKFPIIGFIGY